MSSYTTTSFTELGGKLVVNRSPGATSPTSNALSGSGSIFMIEFDNEANSSASFLKIVDGTSATISTTTANGAGTPDFTFFAPSFSKVCFAFPQGLALSTGLTYWVTTSSAVGSQSSPTSSVIVKFLCG